MQVASAVQKDEEEELEEETRSTHGSEVTTCPRDSSKIGGDELEDLSNDLHWDSSDDAVLEEGKERREGRKGCQLSSIPPPLPPLSPPLLSSVQPSSRELTEAMA